MLSSRVADLDTCEDLISRIVSRSGTPTHATRRDLERELRDHLEDAIDEARAEGVDEASILRIVCDRFGDPDEIARELTVAHRFERTAISMARSVALLAISILTVGGPILALQLLIAMCSGRPPLDAFPHFREETTSFGSLHWGTRGCTWKSVCFTNGG